MWTKEITDMIVSGVWATLYMTLASTILGYVFAPVIFLQELFHHIGF